MRCTRLLSWTLFVVFFLVYLTAIKMVRGNHHHHQQYPQQHFIQQVAPLYSFQQPYQFASGHLPSSSLSQLELDKINSQIASHQFKQARDLNSQHQNYVTFETQQNAQQLSQQVGQSTLTRRNHLPHQQPQQQPIGPSGASQATSAQFASQSPSQSGEF